jgi:hypothetical protein
MLTLEAKLYGIKLDRHGGRGSGRRRRLGW